MSLSRLCLTTCQPLAKAFALAPSAPCARLACRPRMKQQSLTPPSLLHQRPSGRRSISNRRSIVAASLADQVKEKNQKHPVIVYSKTWCPYCAEVKGLFKHIKVDFMAVELDEVVEGEEVMDALWSLTDRRTVPQVFINGDFIGGCDDTVGAYQSGELAEKLAAAGIDADH